MIGVKQAISAAVEGLKNIYEEHVSDLLLEEVERSDDGKHWLITLSLASPPPVNASLQNQFQQLSSALRPPARSYKLIKIDADTGEFVSMKIREAQAA
jgi:hypothetical protein